MSERKTRRDVLKGGVAAAAAAAIPAMSPAQQPVKPEIDTALIEKQLAQPLSEEAKKLLATSIKSNRETSEARLKTKCPENSEPSFSFSPRPKEKRSW